MKHTRHSSRTARPKKRDVSSVRHVGGDGARRPMTMEEEMRAARAATNGGDDLKTAVVELGKELRSAIKELGTTLSAGNSNKPAVSTGKAQSLLGRELRSALKELGTTLSANTQKPAVNIGEAQRLLGCGRVKVFALIKTGKLKKAEKSGRLTLVTTESIERALAAPPPRESLRQRRPKSGDSAWKPMNIRRLRV